MQTSPVPCRGKFLLGKNNKDVGLLEDFLWNPSRCTVNPTTPSVVFPPALCFTGYKLLHARSAIFEHRSR